MGYKPLTEELLMELWITDSLFVMKTILIGEKNSRSMKLLTFNYQLVKDFEMK